MMLRHREKAFNIKPFNSKHDMIFNQSKKMELPKKQLELTRYDQLKKTAEQLINSQLSTKTEHDIMVCLFSSSRLILTCFQLNKLNDMERHIEHQVNKIQKLRKDKAQMATMLNAEKTTLEKLSFEVKTLQTLTQSIQAELVDMRSKLDIGWY